MIKTSRVLRIFSLIILLSNILLNNSIYWKPENPSNNEKVTIFIDTKESNYFLSYPMYIHINNNNNIITKEMNLNYLEGPSIWSYSTILNNNFEFIINDKLFLDKNQENQFQSLNLNDSEIDIFNQALTFLNRKDYSKSISEINKILKSNDDLTIKARADYMLAEIYLNDFNNYELSANQFHNIINNYPESLSIVKKSYFTLAYIYSNYLDYYSQSIELYNKFLEKYPNDELIESIHYELELLTKLNTSIDSLINISK